MTTIVTRAGKGSALSYAEMDANFNNLNNDKVEVSAIANMLETTDVDSVVQAYSPNLTEFASVNPTPAGLALLDDVDVVAQRTTLGLGTAATAATGDFATAAQGAKANTALQPASIGVTVQAYDADIPTVAASQVEMEAGTETALRSMSPLRVAQAIAVLTKNPVFDTAKASTSGTSIDFTGIPSWAKRITVMFNSVSTSGSSKLIVQLGSTSFETTGYTGSSGAANNSTGFGLDDIANSGAVRMGMCFLVNISGNVWVQSGSIGRSDSAASYSSGGVKTLSGVLDRIRITTVNGVTDTFDGGSINIMYE